MNIRGFLPSSFNEWENRVAAVIFIGGCNWRCPYCHGARLVDNFQSLPEIAFEQIARALSDRRAWIDGVVITGGEPTAQDDLIKLLRDLRALNFPLKLSTNGSRPEIIKNLLAESGQTQLLSCLSFDYKAPLDDRLNALTMRECFAEVRQSFALARQAIQRGEIAEVEFHTTLCPTFIDREILAAMAAELNCPNALWILQQYENDVEMLDARRAGLRRFSDAELTDLVAEAQKIHPKILLRRGK